MCAELQEFVDDLQRLREQPPRLDGMRVAVISGTRAGRRERALRAALNAAHRTTAGQCGQGRFVPAERSGHLVMFSEPEIVVAEICRMLESVPR